MEKEDEIVTKNVCIRIIIGFFIVIVIIAILEGKFAKKPKEELYKHTKFYLC